MIKDMIAISTKSEIPNGVTMLQNCRSKYKMLSMSSVSRVRTAGVVVLSRAKQRFSNQFIILYSQTVDK